MEGGPDSNTASGDIVMIVVPPDPPYGAIFEPDTDGKALVLRHFEKVNGKFGPLQKHGGIHYGDVLFGINDVRLDVINFQEALAMLNDRNLIKKQLKFINGKEYYIRRRASGAVAQQTGETNKVSFMSTVSRFKINDSDPKKPFAEFEIKSQFRVPGNKISKDIVHKWSIWRRYSEFEALNTAMKNKLGWLMNGFEFPAPHNFSLRKLEADFLEQRKEDLNKYWQLVIKIDKVAEFTKHFCSEDLKRFLEVEEQLKSAQVSTPESRDGSGGGGAASEETSGSSGPGRLQKTASMRRRSLKPGGDGNDVFGTGVTSVLGSQSSAAPVSRPQSTTISTSSSSSSVTAPTASTASTSSSSAVVSKPSNPPPAAAQPAKAPPAASKPAAVATSKPTAAPTPAAKSAPSASIKPEEIAAGKLPPKPVGARADLFADIARRRIE